MLISISDEAKKNTSFRKILYKDKYSESIVMHLKGGEEIPWEEHQGTQYIQVVSGMAEVTVKDKMYRVFAGEMVVVPPKTQHHVKNASNVPLKLATIYAPPEH